MEETIKQFVDVLYYAPTTIMNVSVFGDDKPDTVAFVRMRLVPEDGWFILDVTINRDKKRHNEKKMSYFSICQELQDRNLDATPRNFMDLLHTIVTGMAKVLVSED
jgi:hypothetical protein